MSNQLVSPVAPDIKQRMNDITTLLLANRRGSEDWGEISHLEGKPCSKKIANKFLLRCLLDYQMIADVAWENGRRLVENILGDPDDIWKVITSVSEADWASKWREYRLHRFPAGHNRLWRIGRRICDSYDGDARRIWEGKQAAESVERLVALGAGEQISRMIVGGLRDSGQIGGAGDVKADRYICRVLGRSVLGKPVDAETAAELARQMHPDPWQLDWPLWNVGKNYCRANDPSCSRCYLKPPCAYANNLPATETNAAVLPAMKIASETCVTYEEAKTEFARALSVTTYNSEHPRFLYFEFEKGKYEKVPFTAYAAWIEKGPTARYYPEWRLKKI